MTHTIRDSDSIPHTFSMDVVSGNDRKLLIDGMVMLTQLDTVVVVGEAHQSSATYQFQTVEDAITNFDMRVAEMLDPEVLSQMTCEKCGKVRETFYDEDTDTARCHDCINEDDQR